MGTSTEDDPIVQDGAAGPQPGSLASRVDAFLAEVEEEDVKAPDATLDSPLDLDDMELMPEPRKTPIPPPRVGPPPAPPNRPPPPIPRPTVVVPPRVAIPALKPPPARPPIAIAIPAPKPVAEAEPAPPEAGRLRRPSNPPPAPGSAARAERDGEDPKRAKRPTNEPLEPLSPAAQGAQEIGHLEVGTGTPNIVVDQPLEAHLDSPTVVDRAIAELGDAGGEKRAEVLTQELEATTDAAAAAYLAYELGELFERRLADEARAVKAYGRALTLDPSLRPNLWAIRRVFYRRGLWPNLAKLIAAEVAYARDDLERADLLLEKARVVGHQLADRDEARSALEEAVRIAPQHQGALLELERIVAKAGDVPALLEVWERLADAVEQPARKVSYWLEVARAAGGREYPRAQAAFDHAAALATGAAAERVARERLRIAEEHGRPEDVNVAIDALAVILLAGFGPAGPGAEPGLTPSSGPADARPDRATALRRELVALRRRQAQLSRADAPAAAWDTLQQALALSPGEPIVLADLTELAEELGRYDDLAELVQSWQAVEGDPGRAMVLSIRRADALLRGGQREQARALLASLEAQAPGFIVLTSAAERDALGRREAPELARTYLAAAHAAHLGSWLGPGQPPAPDPLAAAALYVQAAELLAYEVGGADALDEARGALGKALEAVPNWPPAVEAFVELDDTTGNVVAGLERIRASANAASGDGKRAIFERGIRLARSHGDLESVLGLEREVCALAPSELPLMWRLESTLGQLGRDEERATLLTEIAVLETDATRRGTALLGSARLRERAGAVEAATDLYRQILLLWPEDTFVRESLVDLLRAQERWTELVAERRAEARVLPDGPPARRALREAAWVLEVRLNDLASAAQVYDEWLVRVPDDQTALEGAARCRAQFGDRLGEVHARQVLAELDHGAEAQWLLGRSYERAGQFDEAADVFRALALRPEPSVAATSAALALADLAAGRADSVMRVEATAALAGRTVDPSLGAALAEDSGWMYALVLEDFERAAQSYDAAIALEPMRRGALLGGALVAARRSENTAVAIAYQGLAAAVQMPEAAAALHLRAAAIAVAGGDLELANQRVAAARIAAPDDTSALLVVAETMPTPHVDTNLDEAAAAKVIDPLLARAEVLEMRGALADDPDARASWELDRAEALELAGRLREAGAVVTAVLKTHPEDLRALEALRRMAERAGDKRTWADANYTLARVLGDHVAKLSHLRAAISVYDDANESGKAPLSPLALATLRRILAVDPGAPELHRLLELLRQRADVRSLVAALTDRLTWLDADSTGDAPMGEIVPLLLERATVLHGLGDQAAAMVDLDALLERDPNHLEALRFRADLALNAGEAALAVALWKRYLAVETRPQRRSEIELALSNVLAENVNDMVGAIENLERVVAANPDDIQLHERLLGLCVRAGTWERATRELKALARLRPTPQDKAREELRLGLMLRDKVNDRASARLALDRARTLDPLNLDVVRDLVELLEPPARTHILTTTTASFRASIVEHPGHAVLYERLAATTGWQSDVDARWLALVGLEALGTPSVDQRQVLAQGRANIAAPMKSKLDEGSRAALRGPLGGALLELWRAIAPGVQVATGVDPGKLGFVRGDRVAVKKLGDKYQPLATALACFGVDQVEIFISSGRTGAARALAAETPILCVTADIAAASTPQQRFALGRTVATIADGLAALPDLRDGELGWTIVAALRAAEVAIPPALAEAAANDETSIAERTRVLKKELGRGAKKVIQALAQKAGELVDVAGFRRAALAAPNRAGLLWAGDLAVVLERLDVGKGGKTLVDSPAALDLVAWSVGEEHVKLRERLGVGLKGTR